jgi:hypothetical protein
MAETAEDPVTSVSDEPPPWVTQRTLWRLAMCVIRDHRPGPESCVGCDETWPCECRTLAERALFEAQRRPRQRPVRNQAYLDWLRQFGVRPDEP